MDAMMDCNQDDRTWGVSWPHCDESHGLEGVENADSQEPNLFLVCSQYHASANIHAAMQDRGEDRSTKY
jgi:hypothetical protein